MNTLRNRIAYFFHLIYNVYAGILFVAIMLLIFPFVLLASLFGPLRGGNMIMFLCHIWAQLWFPLVGLRYRAIHEEKYRNDKPDIVVANHISFLDAAILARCFTHPFRPLAKVEMSRIPIFGYIYRYATVMVDRKDNNDRVQSVQRMKDMIRHGVSIFIFPEGTFNMTHRPLKDFFDGAFRVAIQTQTPIRPLLFLDAYDRLHYAKLFSLTPGPCRVVFLEEIPVEGLQMKDLPELKKKVYQLMEQRLLDYKASWIRQTEQKS